MMILIKNGTLVAGAGENKADLLMDGGVIKRIGQGIAAQGADVFDAAGLCVLPGLVDIHGHLREPGQEYKETIKTGTAAAVKGGYTSVCCMANTSPTNDCGAVTAMIVARAARDAACRVYPIGALSKGLRGEEMAEMADMKDAGIVAVSDDGRPVRSSALLRSALQYAAHFGLPLISHAEDPELVADGLMNEGAASARLGLMGIPAAAESAAIAREVAIAEDLQLPLHIAHVSARQSVAIIRAAKARGAAVTCETAPHYLAGTDELCGGYNTAAKVSPPLRGPDDQEALIEGLLDGTVDCIATDHAPHHQDDKRVEFALAANGITGYETALALCYTALVASGRMSLAQLIRKLTSAPAAIMGLPGGTLAEGAPADVTVFDPAARWTIRAAELISKGKNTPFDGRSVQGRVVRTYVGGKLQWEDKA